LHQISSIQAVYVKKYDTKGFGVEEANKRKDIRKSLNLTLMAELTSELESTLQSESSDDLLDEDQEQSFSQYEKVLFFIDEQKHIQLIHLTDAIFTKDMASFQNML
jgi:hypothetical protein